MANDEISNTFSICAAEPEAGICGGAVASKYPAVGRVVVHAKAGVGAFCTQHYHNPKFGPKALELLEAGKTCEDVIAELLRDDDKRDQRQLAIVDKDGRAMNRNPPKPHPSGVYWGAFAGKNFAVQGNTLAGRGVIELMAAGFEDSRGSFADRLMRALLYGDHAGGDHRGKQAAGIRVCKTGVEGYWLELYVDDHADAVTELARLYAELKHDAKGT